MVLLYKGIAKAIVRTAAEIKYEQPGADPKHHIAAVSKHGIAVDHLDKERQYEHQ